MKQVIIDVVDETFEALQMIALHRDTTLESIIAGQLYALSFELETPLDDTIECLWKAGNTNAQIARRLGVTNNTVANALIRNKMASNRRANR